MNSCPRLHMQAINDHGAGLIQQGLYKHAIDVMTSGLQIVRHAMATLEATGEDHAVHDDMCVDSEGSPAAPIHQGSPDHERCPQVQPLSSSDCGNTPAAIHWDDSMDEITYLYVQPIFACHPHHSLETYGFMMMFNMALCYHLDARTSLMGIQATSLSHATSLESALRLYELAYKMQLNDDVEVDLLHSCAMVNNMAQIQFVLRNEEAACGCLKTLLAIVMSLVEDRTNNEASYFMDESLAGFLHNTSCLILKEPLTAAAA